MVIFVEQPDKTLLDWCKSKWNYYLNAKININRIFLSYNCDLSFIPVFVHYRSNYTQSDYTSFVNLYSQHFES